MIEPDMLDDCLEMDAGEIRAPSTRNTALSFLRDEAQQRGATWLRGFLDGAGVEALSAATTDQLERAVELIAARNARQGGRAE